LADIGAESRMRLISNSSISFRIYIYLEILLTNFGEVSLFSVRVFRMTISLSKQNPPARSPRRAGFERRYYFNIRELPRQPRPPKLSPARYDQFRFRHVRFALPRCRCRFGLAWPEQSYFGQ
jgi:hypothetical protein